MSDLQDEVTLDNVSGIPDAMAPLDLGDLDLTTDEFILDEVDTNLEDDLVKEALNTGVDLRHYSNQVEGELEQSSIKDCIHSCINVSNDCAKELVHYLW